MADNHLLKRTTELLVTEFGVGSISKLSTSIASLFGIALHYLTSACTFWEQTGIFFVFLIAAIALTDRYERDSKTRAPQEIVLDSTFGMWASLIFVWDANFLAAIIALVLFRMFAALKPFPINVFQTFKGGAGIVADDLASAMLTNIIVRILLFKEII